MRGAVSSAALDQPIYFSVAGAMPAIFVLSCALGNRLLSKTLSYGPVINRAILT
jgi:hypothetical protein